MDSHTAMAADALKIRTITKSTFTRKKNDFFKAIAANESIEVIRGKFQDLKTAFHQVEGKHELYLLHLDDEEEITKGEEWMTKIQEIYSEANSILNKHDLQVKIDQLFKKKKTLETMFKSEIDYLNSQISNAKSKASVTALRKSEQELTKIFNDCKTLHAQILEMPLEQKYTEIEIEWVRQLHAHFTEINGKIESFICSEQQSPENKQAVSVQQTQSILRLEKAKMPLFNGEIRNYPQFKRDFQKQAITNHTE